MPDRCVSSAEYGPLQAAGRMWLVAQFPAPPKGALAPHAPQGPEYTYTHIMKD
ncbi:hypothetical protein GCM10010307_87510 [Streptomyces vastus]|uniref:Uncharacterized protein n=1 Tax=Streptomyces vastus TaxID=285451 RepID=A0ABP6EEC1_9ACTN